MEGMKYWIGTVVAGLNSNATRTVRGAISFNSSTHLPPSAGSPLAWKPVMLPPGCARFVAKPLPIGSDTDVNTIGIVLVSRARARTRAWLHLRWHRVADRPVLSPTSSSYPYHRRSSEVR